MIEEIRKGQLGQKTGLPYGVIFDMDGVLVDSEEFICKAACTMFSELGLEVQKEDFLEFVGRGEDRYIGGVAEKYRFDLDLPKAKKRTYDIYLEIIKGEMKPLAGVYSFIDKCRAMGKRIAVASSADRRKVQGNLKEIGFSVDSFDAVIVGEDVIHKKPSPDIFLLAASRLGISAEDCLVVEDAVSGVEAAKAAGSKCLAVTSSFCREQLTEADFISTSLADAPDETLNWE